MLNNSHEVGRAPIVDIREHKLIDIRAADGQESMTCDDAFSKSDFRGCHRHGRLHDYRSTLSLYFDKSNSSVTLVDLISLLILSSHVILILSYPHIFTFLIIRSLSSLQMHWLF